ncbi:MAG TPA: SDR family NAD(P)-dependent oxidoreductase, partial [Vicinamibacterales bacterium]|nr:SDR family NAD(P)-dependent oxidoreductase [Vicinamibacterales bacterium]
MRFSGKICLVTGGGSGIGRAACERFAREGGSVAVVDLNEEHGQDTVRHISAHGGESLFAKADVSNTAEVRAAI